MGIPWVRQVGRFGARHRARNINSLLQPIKIYWLGRETRGVCLLFPEIVFIWLVFVWFWMNNCTLLLIGIMKDPPQESLWTKQYDNGIWWDIASFLCISCVEVLADGSSGLMMTILPCRFGGHIFCKFQAPPKCPGSFKRGWDSFRLENTALQLLFSLCSCGDTSNLYVEL